MLVCRRSGPQDAYMVRMRPRQQNIQCCKMYFRSNIFETIAILVVIVILVIVVIILSLPTPTPKP